MYPWTQFGFSSPFPPPLIHVLLSGYNLYVWNDVSWKSVIIGHWSNFLCSWDNFYSCSDYLCMSTWKISCFDASLVFLVCYNGTPVEITRLGSSLFSLGLVLPLPSLIKIRRQTFTRTHELTSHLKVRFIGRPVLSSTSRSKFPFLLHRFVSRSRHGPSLAGIKGSGFSRNSGWATGSTSSPIETPLWAVYDQSWYIAREVNLTAHSQII